MEPVEPSQTPEGRLIEQAAKADGRSVRALAANAGISDTRWRHIVNGWQPSRGGKAKVHGPAGTLARMALVLGVEPDQLEEVGRPDAASELQQLRDGTAVMSRPAARAPGAGDEISLIYESKTMSPRQKLEAIGMVLRLRAELEAQQDDAGNRDPAEKGTGGDVRSSA